MIFFLISERGMSIKNIIPGKIILKKRERN